MASHCFCAKHVEAIAQFAIKKADSGWEQRKLSIYRKHYNSDFNWFRKKPELTDEQLLAKYQNHDINSQMSFMFAEHSFLKVHDHANKLLDLANASSHAQVAFVGDNALPAFLVEYFSITLTSEDFDKLDLDFRWASKIDWSGPVFKEN
jgi:hypothetical protein